MSSDERPGSHAHCRTVGVSYGISRTVGRTPETAKTRGITPPEAETIGITPGELSEYIRSQSPRRIRELAHTLKGAPESEQRQETEGLLLLEIEAALRHCPEWIIDRLLGDGHENEPQGDQP